MARGYELRSLPYPEEPGWTITRLARSLRINARERGPEGDEAAERLVASIWEEACRERPSLFDGRVFVADRVEPDRIEGYWTEYRRVFARLRRPASFPRPHKLALAVNGLIACADGLVLGRRQAAAIYRPGAWQAAPAGSVEARDGSNAVDLRSQLSAELSEELGLDEAALVALEPVAAIEHPNAQVVDIGCLLTLDAGFATVERSWRRAGNGEYDALRLVAPADVRGLLDHADPDMLPSARILLRCWLERQPT